MTATSGALYIDKASGMTSHDVVARVRRILGERRVGHAGTLDPMATGLLILGVGPATRLLRFAQGQDKRYRALLQLGVATDTLDAQGREVARARVPELSLDALRAAAAGLLGEQSQVPPMVSALHHEGRRLHELARAGLEVERAPRPIRVRSLEVAATYEPTRWELDVTCSAGTYVRVLASDLAVRLGTLGHLVGLRRLASGTHDVADAVSLEQLAEQPARFLRPARELVCDMASALLSDEQVLAVRRGQRVELTDVGEVVAGLDRAGELVGVLERRAEYYQPTLVLAGAS